MKCLLIILPMIAGCSHMENKTVAVKPEVDTVIYSQVDTFKPQINQIVWHTEGGYHLQTYVLTKANQSHPTSNTVMAIGWEGYSPYYEEIMGTFDYIKRHKKSEFDKAYSVLYKYPDSVKMLNAIAVK